MRCSRPTCRATRSSAGAPLESVEAIADWLLALLDAAGVDEAALVGHSMGSLIALEAAARAPARVERLVMVGTAYPMKVSPALLEAGAKGSVRRDRQGQRLVDLDPGRQALVSRPRHVAARRRPHADAPAAGGATRGQPVPHRLPGLRSLSRRPRGGGARRLPDDAGARRARPDDLAEARRPRLPMRCGRGSSPCRRVTRSWAKPRMRCWRRCATRSHRTPKQPPASARPARRARARCRG